MSSSKGDNVLIFTGKHVGNADAAIPEDPECEVIEFDLTRLLRPNLQRTIPPPAIPNTPVSLAAWLTAGMRGPRGDPGRWPNLGVLIEKLVRARLKDGRLHPHEAKQLVEVIQKRLEDEGLCLQDASTKMVLRVESELRDHGENAMLYSIECSERHADARLIDYRPSFYRPAFEALCPKRMSHEDFKDGVLWSVYALVIIVVYRCVEVQVRGRYATRQEAPAF